jgi:hypothetical protein
MRARALLRRRFGWKPYPDEVTPECALCGGTEHETVGRRVLGDMRYRTVLCADCGLVYLCPRPSAASFVSFYENLFPRFGGGGTGSSVPSERGRRVAQFLAANLDLPTHRGVFDVGCGDASLLRAFANHEDLRRLVLAGVDPGWPNTNGERIVENATEISVTRGGVEDVGDFREWSIVVMYDVLEHLLDPRGVLARLHSGVADDTVLCISTNCLDCWEDIPPAGWETYYLRLAHTYTFTRQTLAALLVGSGWKTFVWQPAEKGDQWVLARRADPRPEALAPIAGEADAARTFIERYRARVRA